ncbi:hypothetical protein PAAG_01147 [Paracoccidioides lutzii Pb01]|uniref:DUF1750 domain-containing protein n=1 Tax=Paracoccidioides lutzii (strain ATCC MYA-826 / Pb01) TaxID=502779 RepID=C1GRK2_PARBA|nr:hypothetical protein PAAG_01147 [Paracoccidioides lutzii Pb01]EEH38226.1 hypothetical protein PAAG_01147 [Paracoccidioides lutzii Pb01]
MPDPAGGVPQQLLPHMHLVSSYRYPLTSTLSHETAVDYLISAPKVVRELQTVHWMFLDGPPDGTVLLTWQPLNYLGTNFASDGYFWADAEQLYSTEIRGYNLELYLQRCGYHSPNETIAAHCRKRYRLTPSKNPNANVLPCDPSLWIIHYSKTPSVDQLPVNRIQITPQMHNILAQRRFLQSQGQLVRKEFMLHDRNSWPTINLPPQVGQQNFAQQGVAYANPLLGRQQAGPFYQPQPGQNIPGPQGKAARSSRSSAAAAMANVAVPDYSLEEEEVSTGDMLDAITPRDISKMRYRHHHEWMDEIFGSPYSVRQIMPVDLGLGRKGELESLTSGFFDAPTGPSLAQKELSAPNTTGKMETGKAEAFAKSVDRKVSDINAEIEKMKKIHAKRLEKMKRITVLKEAELALRDAFIDPDDVGTEFWRAEGRLEAFAGEESLQIDYPDNRPKAKVDDIVRNLERHFGKAIVPISEVACVEKGGLQERAPTPKPANGSSVGDVDMAGANITLPGQLDGVADSAQRQPPAAITAVPAPVPITAPSVQQTDETEKANVPLPNTTTQAPSVIGTLLPAVPSKPDISGDVEMGGVESDNLPTTTTDQETGDWVMVSKEDNFPANESTAPTEGNGKPSSAELSVAVAGAAAAAPATGPPGSGLQGLTTAGNIELGEPSSLETNNFDDAAGFSNIDSAGDALAAYSEQNDDLGMEELDNSAFGEAFHASEAERGEQQPDNEEIS